MQRKQKRARRAGVTLENLDREIALLEDGAGAAAPAAADSEKDSLALDHEMRKLTEDMARANSRLSVARLELDRLKRESRALARADGPQREAVAEKEAARRASRNSKLSAKKWKSSKCGRRASREEHAALRVELAALEERHRAERAAMSRGSAARPKAPARRDEIAREIERLGIERARLLADNIELDRKSAELAEQVLDRRSRSQPPGDRRDATARAAGRADEEAEGACAPKSRTRTRSARRSKWIW